MEELLGDGCARAVGTCDRVEEDLGCSAAVCGCIRQVRADAFDEVTTEGGEGGVWCARIADVDAVNARAASAVIAASFVGVQVSAGPLIRSRPAAVTVFTTSTTFCGVSSVNGMSANDCPFGVRRVAARLRRLGVAG